MALDDRTELFRPSINTMGTQAFTWYISPHLTKDERETLHSLWVRLPPFNPLMPNLDPSRFDQPARPKKIGATLWDWSDCFRAIRWFICPCVLRGHECGYTGERPIDSRGWHEVCIKQVCELSPVHNEPFLTLL